MESSRSRAAVLAPVNPDMATPTTLPGRELAFGPRAGLLGVAAVMLVPPARRSEGAIPHSDDGSTDGEDDVFETPHRHPSVLLMPKERCRQRRFPFRVGLSATW